ncbi:MAG: transposase [Acidimicrobiales bacterium]
MIKRALGALPAGLGRARLRFDSGLFSGALARACLELGCDYAMAVPHNKAFWRTVHAMPAGAWTLVRDMAGAEVAEAAYHPNGWPVARRAIVRRVRGEKDEVRSDTRSRRLRSIDPEELAVLRRGERDYVFAYSMVITSLQDEVVELEHWFRERGQVEERLCDSKHGATLRHLPSGYKVVNAVWMWSAFLALDIFAVLSASSSTSIAT